MTDTNNAQKGTPRGNNKDAVPRGNGKPGGGSQVPDRQQGRDIPGSDNVDIVDTTKGKKL